jgi:hypothetical protein
MAEVIKIATYAQLHAPQQLHSLSGIDWLLS